MCLPLQLSHRASLHICLSRPNIQNRDRDINKHNPSTHASSPFPLNETVQPPARESVHLAYPSLFRHFKAVPPQDFFGTRRALSPPPFQEAPQGSFVASQAVYVALPAKFCHGLTGLRSLAFERKLNVLNDHLHIR